MSPGLLLARMLTAPERATRLGAGEWTALLAAARAEQLIGSLGERLADLSLPAEVAAILADARADAALGRRQALWEAEAAARALATLGAPTILLKGTAYLAAGLQAGVGRSVGDLDILVPRLALADAEAALLAAGWEWVKPDPYDDEYYRRWMHELPPLIHRERDRMIDVHHTILPPTASRTPDAAALIADSMMLANGWRVLSPEDMIVHAAAHLIADGDLSGGLRNLWDIDRLCREFAPRGRDFYLDLAERAWEHDLLHEVERALRLARQIFVTPVIGYRAPLRFDLAPRRGDTYFRRRLLARDGWGRATRPLTRFGFYLRSHWMRMPPALLARHLWIKARRGAGRRDDATTRSR